MWKNKQGQILAIGMIVLALAMLIALWGAASSIKRLLDSLGLFKWLILIAVAAGIFYKVVWVRVIALRVTGGK